MLHRVGKGAVDGSSMSEKGLPAFRSQLSPNYTQGTQKVPSDLFIITQEMVERKCQMIWCAQSVVVVEAKGGGEHPSGACPYQGRIRLSAPTGSCS